MSEKKEKKFSEMENTDQSIFVGQRVQLVGKIDFNEQDFIEESKELKIKAKDLDASLNRCKTRIENINKLIEDGIQGTVVSEISYEVYLIRFDEESEYFSTFCEDIDLKKRIFLEFDKKNILPLLDKNVQSVSMAIFNKKNSTETNIIDKIRENKKQKEESLQRLVDISKETQKLRMRVVASDENEELLFNSLLAETNTDEKIEKQIQKLVASPKVESIDYVRHNNEDFLIVKTAELEYRSSRCTYQQGHFFLVINLTREDILAYGSKYNRNATHPCINGFDGGVCFGEQRDQFLSMIKRAEISQFIFQVINFLEEPNYSHPYNQDFDTFFSQTIKPVKEIDIENPILYVTKINEIRRVIENNFNLEEYEKAIETKAGRKIRSLENEDGDEDDEEEDADE